ASRKVVECIAGADTPEKGIKALREFCVAFLGVENPDEPGRDAGRNPMTHNIYLGISDYRNGGDDFMEGLHDQITEGVAGVS
ncbi:MAG: hypothetical protein DRO99_01205, partial [Candidatus Aenigmatarchaeota archaeon]